MTSKNNDKVLKMHLSWLAVLTAGTNGPKCTYLGYGVWAVQSD